MLATTEQRSLVAASLPKPQVPQLAVAPNPDQSSRDEKVQDIYVRRRKVGGVAGTILVAVLLAAAPSARKAIAEARSADVPAGLLDKSRDTVLGEIGQGKVDAAKVTEVKVGKGGYAYNVASRIEGHPVAGDDSVVEEVLKQTGNDWDNTYIAPGVKVILNKSDVSGNPPNAIQEIKAGHDVQR